MKILVRLLKLIAPLRAWIALAVLLGAGTIASGIGLMAASAYLISAAALYPSIADLSVVIVAVRVFGISRGVLRYLERLVSHTISLKLLGTWRVWFYNALEPLAPARLLEFHSGDLLARAVADVDSLQDFYVRVIAPPLVAVVIALGMTLFLWQFNATLALLFIAAWLVAGLGLPVLIRRAARQPTSESIMQRAILHTQLVDSIQGLADITAFGQQGRVLAQVAATGESFGTAQMRLAWVNALSSALGTLAMHWTMLVILVAGIVAVSSHALDAVYLATLALASAASFEAVLAMPQAAQALEQALAAARRLLEIVDTEPAVQDSAKSSPLPHNTSIVVRDLGFTYPGSTRPALDGISFTISEGHHVAIVGPSGAGKSTLVSLLARFWEYDAGEIALGGISLRAFCQEDVRKMLGVISQDTYLFNATVRDNLRLAKPDADDAALRSAAARARIDDLIETLSHCYDTLLGEYGANLSGGERQRLALARALLRDAPILILDEPTANLDALIERALLNEISDSMRGRTLLLITHRLVGLEAMDEILVLEAGRIVERGTHAQLLANESLYSHLWHLQNVALLENGSNLRRTANPLGVTPQSQPIPYPAVSP